MNFYIDSSGIKSNFDNFTCNLKTPSTGLNTPLKKIQFPDLKFFQSSSDFGTKIKQINAVDLKSTLEKRLCEIIESDFPLNSMRDFESIARALTIDDFQDLIGIQTKDLAKYLEAMVDEARLFLRITQKTDSQGFRASLSAAIDALLIFLQNIIGSFGIGDFFKQQENDVLAQFKSEKTLTQLTFFTTLATATMPILGAAKGAIILGSVFLTILGFSIIWPFIKPMPTALAGNSENWTKETRKGSFIHQGRKSSLNEIADIIKMGRHPLLVGPSRVGKSLTAKAFAQALDNGEYPELLGKTVFRINMADIVDLKPSFLGGGNNVLNEISESMGRHRDKIILVFDEIHMACKGNEKISDKLKTLLDEGGSFPHVIGITTETEYNKYIKENDAFDKRFDKVLIQSTDEHETIAILHETILKVNPKSIIEPGILSRIYQRSLSKDQNIPQPNASIKILERCINMTEKAQQLRGEQKIIELSSRILSQKLDNIISCQSNNSLDNISKLEAELGEIKEKLNKERRALAKLFDIKDLLTQVTRISYETVAKISRVTDSSLKKNKDIKLFILLHDIVRPFLTSYIKEKSKALGVKVVIDAELVEELA